ncbi:UNC5C-like protein [Ptychodera flava]|uniref:UNC5C-like protein n=1 Tax=Ptychodera flava TaxID=63121 RepID=UPI00396A47C6
MKNTLPGNRTIPSLQLEEVENTADDGNWWSEVVNGKHLPIYIASGCLLLLLLIIVVNITVVYWCRKKGKHRNLGLGTTAHSSVSRGDYNVVPQIVHGNEDCEDADCGFPDDKEGETANGGSAPFDCLGPDGGEHNTEYACETPARFRKGLHSEFEGEGILADCESSLDHRMPVNANVVPVQLPAHQREKAKCNRQPSEVGWLDRQQKALQVSKPRKYTSGGRSDRRTDAQRPVLAGSNLKEQLHCQSCVSDRRTFKSKTSHLAPLETLPQLEPSIVQCDPLRILHPIEGEFDYRANHHGNGVLPSLLTKFRQMCASDESKMVRFNLANDRFACGYFDHHGGYLSISAQDILLYVPPGAIEEGQRQIVYLYLFKPCDFSADLPDGCRQVTPVVRCGPPGLKFKCPVVLSLPLIADDVKDWDMAMFTRKSNTTDDVSFMWANLRSDPKCHFFVLGKYLVALLPDFSDKVGGAKPKDARQLTLHRNMRIGLFMSRQHCDTQHAQFRARLWNDNDYETKAIQEYEKSRYVGLETATSRRIRVFDNEEDIKLHVREIHPSNWVSADSQTEQTIESCDIWSKYKVNSDDLCREFAFRRMTAEDVADVNPILQLIFVCFQESKEDFKTVFTVTTSLRNLEEQETPGGEASASQHYPSSNDIDEIFLSRQQELQPIDRKVIPVPLETYWKLCCLLDQETTNAAGYATLASEIGLETSTIHWLRSGVNGPSRRVLDVFFYLKKDQPRHCVLSDLKALMEKIGREDGAGVVCEVMEIADDGGGSADTTGEDASVIDDKGGIKGQISEARVWKSPSLSLVKESLTTGSRDSGIFLGDSQEYVEIERVSSV